MNDIPTREILWNVGGTLPIVAMYAIFALSLAVVALGLWRRFELWGHGKPDSSHSGNLIIRFFDLTSDAFLQRGVVRERKAGIAHSLIYLGFIVLLFTTTMVFLDNDLGLRIYKGSFYLGITVLSDLFGLGLIFGCLIAAHRRYVARIDKLHNRFLDGIFLWSLIALCVQGFILEGLRIHATGDPWAHYSIIGNLFASFFWPLSFSASRSLHIVVWWMHAVNVFVVIALLPYSKLFHIVASSANLFFRENGRPAGALPSPGDLEELMQSDADNFTIGLGTIADYTWKQRLDLDACTSCGRCQEVCPAYGSGKPLSPKWVILDTRNHMLALQADSKFAASSVPHAARSLDNSLLHSMLLAGSGLRANAGGGYAAAGEFRAANPAVQNSVRTLGKSTDDLISGDVIDPQAFWSCNTCYACVEACPVGINHVDQIVGNRRHMALMRGEIPSEAQATLRALETRKNPYGPPSERMKWADGLNVPILKAGDQVDYLYWVGCVSAYDPRKQKIARALVQIMQRAGLSFGVIGNDEGCSGDPARRLGEENLFQSLAKYNIELLKQLKFNVLVANCPHCFNTIKNEYPQLGNLGADRSPQIIHHSKLLKDLVTQGSIVLADKAQEVTFHDPCYLGRYNDEYEAPRDTLVSIGGTKIIEMQRSRNKAMCCGAGGGHFWMDLKLGERVNVQRVNQAAETNTSRIASACPFCMQMLEDGVKLTDRESEMDVRDIAEIVLEQISI